MDLIYEFMKIGMVLNTNTVGYYQRKYWEDSGIEETLDIKIIRTRRYSIRLGAYEGEFTEKTYKEGEIIYLIQPEMIKI